jgi:phosphopantetheinyl transferase (holo-ACP synthase)
MANFSKVDNINMKISHGFCHSTLDNSFTNSRNALKNLLIQKNEVVNDLKSDLTLLNFRELPTYPLYYVSLSHTKELGAAVIALKKTVKGIGIDIEWESRNIKPGALKFFVNPADSHELSLIELWTAKEAAFKALSPIGTYPGVLVLSKIIIQGNRFFTELEPELSGVVTTTNEFIGEKKFIRSIAIIN